MVAKYKETFLYSFTELVVASYSTRPRVPMFGFILYALVLTNFGSRSSLKPTLVLKSRLRRDGSENVRAIWRGKAGEDATPAFQHFPYISPLPSTHRIQCHQPFTPHASPPSSMFGFHPESRA